LWFYGQGCWHPPIHALVAEGVFLPDGGFLALPKLATEPFLKLWEQAVFDLLLAEGKSRAGWRLEAGGWRVGRLCEITRNSALSNWLTSWPSPCIK
jgi:hypothetical protein